MAVDLFSPGTKRNSRGGSSSKLDAHALHLDDALSSTSRCSGCSIYTASRTDGQTTRFISQDNAIGSNPARFSFMSIKSLLNSLDHNGHKGDLSSESSETGDTHSALTTLASSSSTSPSQRLLGHGLDGNRKQGGSFGNDFSTNLMSYSQSMDQPITALKSIYRGSEESLLSTASLNCDDNDNSRPRSTMPFRGTRSLSFPRVDGLDCSLLHSNAPDQFQSVANEGNNLQSDVTNLLEERGANADVAVSSNEKSKPNGTRGPSRMRRASVRGERFDPGSVRTAPLTALALGEHIASARSIMSVFALTEGGKDMNVKSCDAHVLKKRISGDFTQSLGAGGSFRRNSYSGMASDNQKLFCQDSGEAERAVVKPVAVYRPLPDQSAFDRFTLNVAEGGDVERNTESPVLGVWPSTPSRQHAVCPATPQRTPIWKTTSTSTFQRELTTPTEFPDRPTPARPSSLMVAKVLITQFEAPDITDISFARDFEDQNFLGSGTTADVYKVKERGGEKYYAVKKIKQQFRSKKDRSIMMSEVMIMKKLGEEPCDHIVQLVKAWQEDAHFYVQIDFAERGTLSDLLRDVALNGGIFDDSAVWRIAHDVTVGLNHIHKNGIVHLDIKPSNLLISAEGCIKIGDFGLAVDEDNYSDPQEGDTRYMAPELLATSDRQPSADIFSLGLTLYEVCVLSEYRSRVSAGLSPLPTEGPTWHVLRNGFSPVLSYRSDALNVFIKSLLSVAPSDRPTTESLLLLPDIISSKMNPDALLRLVTLHAVDIASDEMSPTVLPREPPSDGFSCMSHRRFWPYEHPSGDEREEERSHTPLFAAMHNDRTSNLDEN